MALLRGFYSEPFYRLLLYQTIMQQAPFIAFVSAKLSISFGTAKFFLYFLLVLIIFKPFVILCY